MPSGFIVGQVFDDGTAQPLSGVRVLPVGGANETTTDARGRYLLAVPATGGQLDLRKSGYTRSARRIDVVPSTAQSARDARLTPLGPATSLGPDGGTVRAILHAPPAEVTAAIELIVPSGALSASTDVHLTALSPQGLIAPVPLGWSVLLGLDLQPAVSTHASTTLRIPLAWIAGDASVSIVVAVWDDASQQWRAGPAMQLVGDAAEIVLPEAPDALSAWGSQLALLVADSVPLQPASAAPGEALPGVFAVDVAGDSAAVLANPPVLVAGTDAQSDVQMLVTSVQLLSSGTVLTARLREGYTLRDSRQLTGTTSEQDLSGYQLSATGTPGSPRLSAGIRLQPSRSFPISELTRGRVTIDITLPHTSEPLSVIDATGGDAIGTGGRRLSVPPNALSQTSVVRLRPAGAAELSAVIVGRSDFVGAFELDSSSALDPRAIYALDLGTAPLDGQRFAVARLATSDGGPGLILIGLARTVAGRIVIEACVRETSLCLDGLASDGIYAVFALPAAMTLVTGTVSDAVAPRAGIGVHSDTLAVVTVTDADGRYILPVALGVASTLTARDVGRDLTAEATVTPMTSDVVTVDLQLTPTAPHVTQVNPPNHAATVALDAAITISFSEPIAAASLTDSAVQMTEVASTTVLPALARLSLSTDATELLITPQAALKANTIYRLRLTDALTDRVGTPLSPFESDFSTAPIFTADALPANALRVSLPDDRGNVFVCGGMALAAPGTFVVVTDTASGFTVTSMTTDRDGGGNRDCTLLFPSRCDTAAPGAFCAVLTATIGERIQVQVEDVLHNAVTLDAGNMRDETTGTTAIGAEGGTVVAAVDPRYHVAVPEGAFASTTLVTVTPVAEAEFPATASATMEFIGGIRLDFGGAIPSKQVDISVPAPSDADAADQYLATQVVNFRGVDELTAVDTAAWDAANGLITTDPALFAGVSFQGLYGVMRTRQCTAYVTGFAALGQHYSRAFIPGNMFLPFPLLQTQTTRWVVPVPCNHSVELTLDSLDGEQIDFLSLPTAPRKGEFVFSEVTLSDDKTPPQVVATQTSIPDHADSVGHDAEISISFNEAIASASIDGHLHLVCRIGGTDVELRGTWSQSADGKRLFFVPLDSQPLHGLPFGTHCELRVAGVKDPHGNQLADAFTSEFTTFIPTAGQIGRLDAVAVDSIGWHQVGNTDAGQPLLKQFVAFAEGDAYRPDFTGGIVVQEVTEHETTTVQLTQPTAGFDYAVHFLPPEDVADSAGNVFHGPYLMSLDGPGPKESRQRFGVWHLYDLSTFPTIRQVVSRIVNHSSDSLERFATLDPAEDPATFHFLEKVPNDLGLPLSVADLGAAHAYIANAPNIGIEHIQVAGIDRDINTQGVDGVARGHFRSVATLGPWVIGGRPDGLIVTDAGLQRNPLLPDYLVNGTQLSVLTLSGWPIDRNRDGKIAADERLDLVVTSCQDGDRSALCVVAFDTRSGTFQPGTLNGVIRLPAGSLPFRAFADPERRLIYLANGTIGLTVIDFQDPSGSLDDSPRDGTDDRVLANVPLQTAGGRLAMARDVAMDINASGHVIAYVAAREDGWFAVDLGPARMRTRLLTYASQTETSNLVEATEVRYFNEKRTTLYQPEVQLPGHLADLYPEEVTLTVTAVDRSGVPVAPLGDNFAPPSVTVVLHRVPQTNRYTMSRAPDGSFRDVLVVSNLPLVEDNAGGLNALMHEKFPDLPFIPVYGGLGTTLRLTADVVGEDLQGKQRNMPIEKVQVILIGIDGLRQDVLYPPDENSVQEAGVDYHIDPKDLPGIGQLFGGRWIGDRLVGDPDAHQYRFPEVTAVFPSITFASWASILTSALPKDTGMLGNEFFARDLGGQVIPTEPPAGVDAPGLLTFSEGAFWRSNVQNGTLNPPVIPSFADPASSAQNLALRGAPVQTIFEQLGPMLRDSGVFAPYEATMIGSMNLYARGLDRRGSGPNQWLTLNPADIASLWLTGGAGREFDRIPVQNAIDYLNEHLRTPGRTGARNGTPFPALFVLYMAGLDHESHFTGHGPTGEKYKRFFADSTDQQLQRFVETLRALDEYYNKIIILTADHGHTNMVDVSDELAPCELRKGLPPLIERPGRTQERVGNNNLSSWELAHLLDVVNDYVHQRQPLAEFNVHILVPDEVRSRLGEPAPVDGTLPGPPVNTTAVTSLQNANVIAALNGPIAHFYVRDLASNTFLQQPRVSTGTEAGEVVKVAEILRVLFGPPPAAAGSSLGLTSGDIEKLQTLAGTMHDSIDFILYRDSGQYRVFDGLDPTTGAVQSASLESLVSAAGDRFVFPLERIRNMNDPSRSGDVVVHFRFDSDAMASERFTAGVSCRAWHGGLGRADSFVPLIVSAPGGSGDGFLNWWTYGHGQERICATGQNSNLDCHGNWLAADMAHTLLTDLYGRKDGQ